MQRCRIFCQYLLPFGIGKKAYSQHENPADYTLTPKNFSNGEEAAFNSRLVRTDLNGIYMKWEDPSYYGMNMRGKEHPEHRCIRVLRTNRQLYFIEEERRKCIPSEIWKMQD